MGYGANEAVEEEEQDSREKIAQSIAENAAELVAAKDRSRGLAVEAATNYQRHLEDAAGDVTRTIETLEEAQRPTPSRKMPASQIRKIAGELMDEARDAARDL